MSINIYVLILLAIYGTGILAAYSYSLLLKQLFDRYSYGKIIKLSLLSWIGYYIIHKTL